MNWRAAEKVATWKLFKWHMKVIFMADQIPEERQYDVILVVGGEEAYNCLDTLEGTVENVKDPEQVWEAFEKSFEQSTSFWHFRDAYLADFRQDPTESTADLDLCIKQTVRECQWKKESEEEQMIDLLYHATIYYEICKYIQESEPATLKYKMVIEKAKAHERNVLEYKYHQASHGGANSMPSYNNPLLTAHALTKRRSSGRNACQCCGKSHERGNCPTCMERLVINARVLIISKPFVIPRLQQPRQCPALTGVTSYSHCRDMLLLGVTVTMAKVEASITRRRRHQRSHQSRKHMRLHSRIRSYQK